MRRSLLAILLYCLSLIALGYFLRHEARSSEGYFLAGRKLSGLQLGLSLSATAFGGSAVLVASMLIYTYGLAGLWFTGSLAAGFLVLGLFFASRIRASGAHSLPHFAGMRYGEGVRRLVSGLIVAVQIAFFGLTVKSFALLTTPLFGGSHFFIQNKELFLALTCGVFVTYTLLGGQKVDVIVDMIKYVVITGVFICLLLPKGLSTAKFSQLPKEFLEFPFSSQSGPLFALNYLVLMGLPGIVGGDVFTKILSARDPRAARNGALIGAAGMLLLALTVAALALCARAILPGLENPALAIPLLARELLPTCLFQVISLSFLAILLSTGDSVLITGATVLTLDVLKLGDQVPMRVVRLVTVSLALLGLGLAIFYSQLLEIMKFGYTLLTAGVAVPMVATLALERLAPARQVGKRFIVTAMAAGLAGASGWQGAKVLAEGFTEMMGVLGRLDPATVGAGCSALVMLLGIIFSGRDASPDDCT